MLTMLRISPSIWVSLLVSLGTLTAYLYLMFRENRKLLKRLRETMDSKGLIVAIYLAFGFALVTTTVYLVHLARMLKEEANVLLLDC